MSQARAFAVVLSALLFVGGCAADVRVSTATQCAGCASRAIIADTTVLRPRPYSAAACLWCLRYADHDARGADVASRARHPLALGAGSALRYHLSRDCATLPLDRSTTDPLVLPPEAPTSET